MVFQLAACDSSVYFKKTFELDAAGWPYGNEAEFDFQIEDTTQHYDIYLDLHHQKSYSFENLYLRATTQFPGDSSVVDVFSIEMADKFGNWLGKCNHQNCHLRAVLQESVRFSKMGKYRLLFEQFNRTDSLQGFDEIALSIVEK